MQGIHFRYHRVARALATRSRNCQHNSNFQCFRHFCLTYKEIPKIALIRYTGSNSLCCINYRTASYREHVPIRIGVNGGSLEKELLAKYGRVTPEALVESALRHVALLEKFDFTDICLSVKSSDVPLNMAAYRLLHERVDYPLHLGVTEAGTPSMGVLKSAIGIGGLLCEGIGDTMRVSLTADPVEEVYAAKRILRACGLRKSGVNLISCPTCGRTAYDMIPLAEELERRLEDCDKPITVAVMGCVVNGPGEASAADIGVAGGKGEGLIFRHGEVLYKVAQEKLLDALLEEIEKL